MKMPSAKVQKYIINNIEDNVRDGELNLTALEEDIMCGFDVADLDEIEEDLSFKVFNYVDRFYPQYRS